MSKKYTQEEYAQKVYEKNPHIEILGKFITTSEHIKVRCKIDGNIWNPIANDLILKKPRGCKVCYERKIRQEHTEKFLNEIKELYNDKYSVLDEYLNRKTPVTVLCKICGHVRPTTPHTLLSGNGDCPNCDKMTSDDWKNRLEEYTNDEFEFPSEYFKSNEIIRIYNKTRNIEYFTRPTDFLNRYKKNPNYPDGNGIFHIKKSSEQFADEVFNLVGNEYEFIEEYVDKDTPILCRHNICGNSTPVRPCNFLGGNQRCVPCQKEDARQEQEQVIIDIIKKDYNDEYVLLEPYQNQYTKIKLLHKICSKEIEIWPSDFKNGVGCSHCSGNYSPDIDEVKQEVFDLCGEEYLVLSDKYINNRSKLLFKHNIESCGHEFPMDRGAFVYSDQRCPKCQESKGERRICNYLISNKINFERQKKYDGLLGVGGRQLSYDFLINDNILCEFQGQYHDGTAHNQTKQQFKKQQEHDKRKKEFAKINNINLIEIWYYEFDNIEYILKEKLNIA